MTGTVLCPRCSRLPRPTVNCSKCKQWQQRAEAKRQPAKEEPMKMLVYAGVTYHCPLSPKYRRHNTGERERMASSGDIEYPVLIYRDKTLGLSNCILDGEGRLETAIENGNIIEFKKVREMTTEEAFERSKALNDARRHDDMAAIQKRRERVSEARAEGKSIRVIAEEEGISKSTVERDLESGSPTVPGGTVAPPPKITGKDGRKRTSSPKRKKAEPARQDQPSLPKTGRKQPHVEPTKKGRPTEFGMLADLETTERCVKELHQVRASLDFLARHGNGVSEITKNVFGTDDPEGIYILHEMQRPDPANHNLITPFMTCEALEGFLTRMFLVGHEIIRLHGADEVVDRGETITF